MIGQILSQSPLFGASIHTFCFRRPDPYYHFVSIPSIRGIHSNMLERTESAYHRYVSIPSIRGIHSNAVFRGRNGAVDQVSIPSIRGIHSNTWSSSTARFRLVRSQSPLFGASIQTGKLQSSFRMPRSVSIPSIRGIHSNLWRRKSKVSYGIVSIPSIRGIHSNSKMKRNRHLLK